MEDYRYPNVSWSWAEDGGRTEPASSAPPTVAPPSAAPALTQCRKAVVIGINYIGDSCELAGCINDAECMAYALRKHFSFQDDEIVMLRDDRPHPDFYPTRDNILRALSWLMQDVTSGSSLFLSFSGHGTQVRDEDGDEADGYDEAICPRDYATAGLLVDDDLNRLLVQPLPRGARLHAVIDACHSGSALDLTYIARRHSGAVQWVQELPGPVPQFKGTAGGVVVQFGACQDAQTAQDTRTLAKGVATGAATFTFLDAMERFGPRQSYAQLISNMEDALRRATKPKLGTTLVPALTSAVMGMLASGESALLSSSAAAVVTTVNGVRRALNPAQKPQLSASAPFNLDVPIAIAQPQ